MRVLVSFLVVIIFSLVAFYNLGIAEHLEMTGEKNESESSIEKKPKTGVYENGLLPNPEGDALAVQPLPLPKDQPTPPKPLPHSQDAEKNFKSEVIVRGE